MVSAAIERLRCGARTRSSRSRSRPTARSALQIRRSSASRRASWRGCRWRRCRAVQHRALARRLAAADEQWRPAVFAFLAAGGRPSIDRGCGWPAPVTSCSRSASRSPTSRSGWSRRCSSSTTSSSPPIASSCASAAPPTRRPSASAPRGDLGRGPRRPPPATTVLPTCCAMVVRAGAAGSASCCSTTRRRSSAVWRWPPGRRARRDPRADGAGAPADRPTRAPMICAAGGLASPRMAGVAVRSRRRAVRSAPPPGLPSPSADLRFADPRGRARRAGDLRAQLLERERGIAETLQRTLLPEQLPAVPGVRPGRAFVPARGSRSVATGTTPCCCPTAGSRSRSATSPARACGPRR